MDVLKNVSPTYPMNHETVKVVEESRERNTRQDIKNILRVVYSLRG